MNIPLRQYSDLFLRYLRPQQGRVALLAVLLLSTTALPLLNVGRRSAAGLNQAGADARRVAETHARETDRPREGAQKDRGQVGRPRRIVGEMRVPALGGTAAGGGRERVGRDRLHQDHQEPPPPPSCAYRRQRRRRLSRSRGR